MSNYRTTADLLDGVLRRCGELTSSQGTSPRQTSALLYLNNIYGTIISGGNELNIDVDEAWVWAKHRRPIIIQVNPSITAGTCTISYGNATGTFSSAPVNPITGTSISLQDYHLKPSGSPECYIIANHTAGSTSFQLDSAFSQTTGVAANYQAFQLDYDLIPSYIIIDTNNNTMDYISNSIALTVNSATLASGSYTPTALATQVATALNAVADGNTYTCTYDSIQRNFKITSNLGGTNPVFRPQGAGTNAYRSGWNILGYDYDNLTGASNYTSVYPLGSLVRFSQPGRVYYGLNFYFGQQDGQIGMLDPVAFDRSYPMIDVHQGTPTAFCIIAENRTGKVKIRLNKYLSTTQAMRIEFDYIEEPRDLFNNAASVPIIPRFYRKILEYGAAYYLSLDKQDSRADTYLGVAQQALKAMLKENRRELSRVGKEFGNVIPRLDLMPEKRHARLNIYGYDSGGV